MATGDWDRALGVIDEYASTRPAPDVRAHLSRLRVAVKNNLLRSLYVGALIVLDHEHVALGTPITGTIVLVNLSGKELRIVKRADGNETTIQLGLRYHEFDVGGTVLTERRQRPVRVATDVVLEPGGRFETPIVLDSLQFGPQRLNYRRYELEALMYPAELYIGGERFSGNLTFQSATCHVFPRNYEHLIDRPLERLGEAVEKNSAIHVPLTAALISKEERGPATRQIMSYLQRGSEEPPDGATRVACCVALRVLTGEDIPAQPDDWLAWWNRRER